jgi:hypothetical protein
MGQKRSLGLQTHRIKSNLQRKFRKVAQKLDPKEMVSFEELLMSNVYTQEALIHLLEAKGFIKRASCWRNSRNSGISRNSGKPEWKGEKDFK